MSDYGKYIRLSDGRGTIVPNDVADEIASLRSQLVEARAKAIEAAKAICPLCRDDVELVPLDDSHYGGWHMLTELGGASDGGTDYEECKAEAIHRSLATTSEKPNG